MQNYYPIDGQTVAQALLNGLTKKNTSNKIEVLNSMALRQYADKRD
jgi:hypothetical protein